MKILWTHSSNPVDWLIWLLTGEDCQHFAILFDSPGGGIVFQVNLLGAGIIFSKQFFAKHKVIHSRELTLTIEQCDALWDKWVDTIDGTSYNIPGALYLGLMKLRKRLFGTALPINNAWSVKGTHFCDEAYQLLSGLPSLPVITPDNNGMMSPHDIWLKVGP